VTVVNNVYVNQRVAGAVTVVNHDTFVGSRHIGRGGMVAMDQREIMGARVIGTSAPIAPQRVSVLGNVGRGSRPPERIVDRTVVVRHAPPPQPVSFETRRSALEANQGRPLDQGQMDRYRGGQRNQSVRVAPSAPAVQDRGVVPREERAPMRPPQQPAQPGGFRRFDATPAQPQPQVQQQQPAAQQPPAQQPPDGRRFGRPDRPGQPAAPAATPAPAPAPRVDRPVDRPRPEDRPRPIDRPRPEDRPRPVDRPAPAAPAPAPAAEPRREPRGEKRSEAPKSRKEAPPKEEKKDK
jgi:hypothetical protein